MKLIVMPIGLQIGGSEINAIELAASVAGRGHDVAVLARPGPLTEMVNRLGLRMIDASIATRGRPHPSSARAIREVVRAEKPDLLHTYEALTCTEAFFGAGFRDRVPVIATLYGMNVDGFLPRAVPVVAGTVEVEESLLERRARERVFRLEPPIDTTTNSPDPIDGTRQRAEWGVGPADELVVIASRLDIWMKIDSLMDAIDSVALLASTRPRIRLIVVGDGPARAALEHRAQQVNARFDRPVVTLVGPMHDPVPAYRAADVVVGMGTSLLRGMSIGRPAVLVGELGHVLPITPDTVTPLLHRGFWGMGDGRRATAELAAQIAHLLDADSDYRDQLGSWSRALVHERFGLEPSTDRLLEMYQRALDDPMPRKDVLGEAVRVPAAVVARKFQDRLPGRRSGMKSVQTPTALGDEYQSANAWRVRHREDVDATPKDAAAMAGIR